jgi:site-specific DNA-adenine methylase
MAKYGIPYMGSKGSHAEQILSLIPEADNLYDLFGGGFSISHCALSSFRKKWKHVHYNEIKADVVDLVIKAINGDFNYSKFKPKWISKEEFKQKKDQDAYIRLIWSFGNNQKNYLFNPELEFFKKSVHNAVVFSEFDQTAKELLGFDRWPDGYGSIKKRRIFYRSALRGKMRSEFSAKTRHELADLQQLEQLQQLQQLERLQQLEPFSTSSLDYRKVPIKENSVIYCDPPYKGTADYGNGFNSTEFLIWAKEHKTPIFISEYEIKHPGFFRIYAKTTIKKLTAKTKSGERGVAIENLYANEAGFNLFNLKN